MINGPVLQAPDARTFLRSLNLRAGTTDRVEGLKVAVSTVLRGIKKALQTVDVQRDLLQRHAVPVRDDIAKFSIAPDSPRLTGMTGSEIDASGRPDVIPETVRAEMADLDGTWTFGVQLCGDLERQPVEDPTVVWERGVAPFQTVVTIRIGRQDSWETSRVDAVDQHMRFNGCPIHEPSGGSRLRAPRRTLAGLPQEVTPVVRIPVAQLRQIASRPPMDGEPATEAALSDTQVASGCAGRWSVWIVPRP